MKRFTALALGTTLAVSSLTVVAQASTEASSSAVTLQAKKKKKCTPGYKPCLPPAYDYDCYGGTGNGPRYTGKVKVKGRDIYRLDYDGDGIGCESVSFWGPVRW